MTISHLKPDLCLLTQEYVLVQAWKKAASYIRHHNWYADTLELDRAAVDLPSFLGKLAEQLSSPGNWENDPLRIVPAPKSQRWHISAKSGKWEPQPDNETGKKLAKIRPLAHVSLKDQVATTALMLCLADRVESRQGDPAARIAESEARKCVLSYGNRLFCDPKGEKLCHRWGSTKLYRAYFVDYRTFIARPDIAADSVHADDRRVVILHADLRQFYDRVRPSLLHEKIEGLREQGDDPEFYRLLQRVLGWNWDTRDSEEVKGYAEQAGMSDFSRVALPQGLVASGFLANVALLDFDNCLRSSFSREIAPGIVVHDACRYVDDLRLVVTIAEGTSLGNAQHSVVTWLQGLLELTARGLVLAEDKTLISEFRGDERPLVRQSRRMERIQAAVSGGFDALGGEEVLDAVQGLIRTQQRYSEARLGYQSWAMSPVPDVRDATVARFAAGRYRSTYRSLRPLLENDPLEVPTQTKATDGLRSSTRSHAVRSKTELDDDARTFALGLIENWVNDPSNVRLLRIGLDLWPSKEVIEKVLELLRPFTQKGGQRKAPRRVAWYCLAEIFRAGATETGFVENDESLPSSDDIDIAAYRSCLTKEAVRLAAERSVKLPWYLRQQVMLYLAAVDPAQAPIQRPGKNPETKHYRDLIRFLKADEVKSTGVQFAIMAILSRRSFTNKKRAVTLSSKDLTVSRLEHIASRDPSFALEILESSPGLADDMSPRLRYDLALGELEAPTGWISLQKQVLSTRPRGPLRNELTLLRFALKFLSAWNALDRVDAITPGEVFLNSDDQQLESEASCVSIVPGRVSVGNSLYRTPTWCPEGQRWRFQLGYLLRFILSGRVDFTKQVRKSNWRESAEIYRVPDSHWYQRMFGLFNGQSAFEDDWLPISDWTEKLLSGLLSWPGCSPSAMANEVDRGIGAIESLIDTRIKLLSDLQGASGKSITLPLTAPWPIKPQATRPLRVCIIQTVVPEPKDFDVSDLGLSEPATRRRHRNHLATALAAVERMLDLRETHKGQEGRLDWLILPELAVHPQDVKAHLVPFARAHKTIILAGLTYEELIPSEPLVNAAIWIVPIWSKSHGLQLMTRRQGKQHLAPMEKKFNVNDNRLHGFRPCQWLVGYEWSDNQADRPLQLTASICYDATDLHLAATLREVSDVFAIPALNKDVNTFDHMAQALHYHMYQMVIVANNGTYGGSNAYVPYQYAFERQVFHLHGQPQATIAFLEIDDIQSFLNRKDGENNGSWKSPPAGISQNSLH